MPRARSVYACAARAAARAAPGDLSMLPSSGRRSTAICGDYDTERGKNDYRQERAGNGKIRSMSLIADKEPYDVTALDFIKEFGICRLGDWFGHCRCTGFVVRNVSVNVSCHKSENTIRVYSHDPHPKEDLREIAEEVRRQISDNEEYRNRYAVRFCEYRFDHKNGRYEDIEEIITATGRPHKVSRWRDDQICVYCEKPRTDKDAYLCKPCSAGDAAKYHLFGVGVGAPAKSPPAPSTTPPASPAETDRR